MQHRNTFESHILLIGGRIRAPRCQALSERSQMQCRKAAGKSKRVCMFHGGNSTGPVTKDGRKHCAIAKTVHGYETREAREYRAKKFTKNSGNSGNQTRSKGSCEKPPRGYHAAPKHL